MLVFCLLFVAGGTAMIAHPDRGIERWQGWLATLFFSACAAAAVVLLLRPTTLSLDAEGLVLAGGMIRTPRRIPWTQAERFRLYRLPRGGRMIGYDKPRDPLADTPRGLTAAFLGVDGSLPTNWTMSSDKLVALLNSYRAQVLG
jgi:hypothetical protein